MDKYVKKLWAVYGEEVYYFLSLDELCEDYGDLNSVKVLVYELKDVGRVEQNTRFVSNRSADKSKRSRK